MRALRVLAWFAVAAWGSFALLRLFGLEHGWPVRPVMAYTPYIAAGVLIPLALAALSRSWRAVAAAAVVATALAAAVLPRWIPAATPAADGPTLRLMTTNLLAGGADLDVLAGLVRDQRVDVLSVQELTPAADAVISGLFAYRVALPVEGVEGTGIYSRFPLTELPALEPRGTGFRMPAAVVEVPGAAPVQLLATHPVAPGVETMAMWVSELDRLPRATPRGGVRILAGDFNSTLDQAPLRRLIDSGYRDAAATVGAGLTWTWPNIPHPTARIPVLGWELPPVTIDHVLADERVGIRAAEVFDLPRTDHRPVLAVLRLPAR